MQEKQERQSGGTAFDRNSDYKMRRPNVIQFQLPDELRQIPPHMISHNNSCISKVKQSAAVGKLTQLVAAGVTLQFG